MLQSQAMAEEDFMFRWLAERLGLSPKDNKGNEERRQRQAPVITPAPALTYRPTAQEAKRPRPDDTPDFLNPANPLSPFNPASPLSPIWNTPSAEKSCASPDPSPYDNSQSLGGGGSYSDSVGSGGGGCDITSDPARDLPFRPHVL